MSDLTSTKALVVFCGIPGSGKTTLIRTLRHIWAEQFPSVIIKGYSVDALSYKDSEEFDRDAWKSARSQCLSLVQEAFTEEKGSCLCYVDDTMYYRSMRKECFDLAVSLAITFRLVYVKCPVDLCLERNASRGNNMIPVCVMQQAINRFEPPDCMKAYWEDQTLVVDSDQLDVRDPEVCKSVAVEIMSQWTQAVKRGLDQEVRLKMKEEGQRKNQQSALYQLDLRLRLIINEKMNQLKSENDKNRLLDIAQSLNELKVETVKSFKKSSDGVHGSIDETLDEFLHKVETEIDSIVDNGSLALKFKPE